MRNIQVGVLDSIEMNSGVNQTTQGIAAVKEKYQQIGPPSGQQQQTGINKSSVSTNASRSNFQSSGLMIASNFKPPSQQQVNQAQQEMSAMSTKRQGMPPQYPASAQQQLKQSQHIMKGKGVSDLYDNQQYMPMGMAEGKTPQPNRSFNRQLSGSLNRTINRSSVVAAGVPQATQGGKGCPKQASSSQSVQTGKHHLKALNSFPPTSSTNFNLTNDLGRDLHASTEEGSLNNNVARHRSGLNGNKLPKSAVQAQQQPQHHYCTDEKDSSRRVTCDASGFMQRYRSNSGDRTGEIPRFVMTGVAAAKQQQQDHQHHIHGGQNSAQKRQHQKRSTPPGGTSDQAPTRHSHQLPELSNQSAKVVQQVVQSPKVISAAHQSPQPQSVLQHQQQQQQPLYVITPQQHAMIQQQLIQYQQQIESLRQLNAELIKNSQTAQAQQAPCVGGRSKRPISNKKQRQLSSQNKKTNEQCSTSNSAETQQSSNLTTFTERVRSVSPSAAIKEEEALAAIQNSPSETSDIDVNTAAEKKSVGSKEEEEKKTESATPEETTTAPKQQPSTKPPVIAKLSKGDLISRQEMTLQRKYLNINRWNCISRPQYAKSCGITSLTACWNYLFSQMGETSQNRKPVLTQEQALSILGFEQPFDEIRFGPFSGNSSILKWFNQLCKHFGVKGSARIFYKPKGSKNVTQEYTPKTAWKALKQGLLNSNRAYIYHCYNHYMCPVGYEEMPLEKPNVFRKDLEHGTDTQSWLVVADQAKTQPTFTCIKWNDILQDLNMENPEYLDVRNIHKGVQVKENIEPHKKGKNCHCIIELCAVRPRERKKPGASAENTQPRPRPIFI